MKVGRLVNMGGGSGGSWGKCNVKHKTAVFSIPYPLCNFNLTTRDPPSQKKYCSAAYGKKYEFSTTNDKIFLSFLKIWHDTEHALKNLIFS